MPRGDELHEEELRFSERDDDEEGGGGYGGGGGGGNREPRW